GGDEFVVFWVNPGQQWLPMLGDRLRRVLSALEWEPLGEAVGVTIGTAYVDSPTKWQEALAEADAQMLERKRQGKSSP
ncbi:MAG: diguanylate cyclase, partial [Myxococcales bacterium]|nr:diguanylate cyclase [Myxococcales bacterium]